MEAFGRTFSHALLAEAVREGPAELDAALDRLVSSGLLFRQSQAPAATYLFKHALVQDAADLPSTTQGRQKQIELQMPLTSFVREACRGH